MDEYVNEKTLIKNEAYTLLPEDLIICPIFQCLMIEPVLCTNCMNNFCKKWADDWNKRSKTCPNGCKDAILKNQIEKNRLITKLKFRCIKGCGEEILFTDIKSHYDSNCLEKKEEKKKEEKKKEEKKNKEKAKKIVYGKKESDSKIKILNINEMAKLTKNKKIKNSRFLQVNKKYLFLDFYSNYIRRFRSWKNYVSIFFSKK